MTKRIVIVPAAGALLASSAALAQGYVAGDIHNHTSYSDGTTSATTLIDFAMLPVDEGGFALDFFCQSGHGGAFSRDGRFDDPEYDGSDSGAGVYWIDYGVDIFLGDYAGTGYGGRQNMWRWQSIDEFQYEETYQASVEYGKAIWSGVEWQVPGHEHCSVAVIGEQFAETNRNALGLAQFEYLFDYRDNDMSGGGGYGWTGKIENIGDGPGAGYVMHEKSVAACAWLQENHPDDSYAIFAHIERKGDFNPDKAYGTGFNIEHFRDFNNAAPDVAFGWEGQPGHQEDDARGGFGGSAFGGGCYGGTGYYCATIGHMWDAMLAEGRNFYLFASSDWHRGLQSGHGAKDFYPGQYQKMHVWVENNENPTPVEIIDGMRSGNVFISEGDLIDELEFTASAGGDEDVTMGETLTVTEGEEVTVTVRFRDPTGANFCPYTDDNPSLLQIDINQPLNMPEVHHVDVISGTIHGYIDPSDPEYTNPLEPTAGIYTSVDRADMTDEGDGWYSFSFTYTAELGGSRYFRLRGTNIPQNTPWETDADGNPLLDFLASDNIPDEFQGLGETLDTDREAYADLWFYSNPVNVIVESVGCPEDINGSGSVDIDDLLAVLAAWGENDPDADIDGSGMVDVDDLLLLLAAWGPCE
jgi:hypothetical protein